jgi:hypothetical protein
MHEEVCQGRWCHTWNAAGLTEALGSSPLKTLHDFM